MSSEASEDDASDVSLSDTPSWDRTYDTRRDPFEALLASLSRDALVNVLRKMDSDAREKQKLVAIITRQLERQQKQQQQPTTTHATDAAEQVQGTKRSRTLTCSGCEKEYDEAENKLGACEFFTWHPSMSFASFVDDVFLLIRFIESLFVNDDDDVWADTDFPEQTYINDVPKGFDWYCCDKSSAHAGCEPYRHVPVADSSNKKSKGEDAS